MISQKQLFFQHLAQTSEFPLAIEMEKAEGCYMFDTSGKKYLDLISGISVSNLGHGHPKIVKAVQEQAAKYMHLLVYGEFVQSPQVELAGLLTKNLPNSLDNVYFVNSGAEAIDGAMKLVKTYTGRTEIVGFKKAYHGSTQGPLSLMGDEALKLSSRPLLPCIKHLELNNSDDLDQISDDTAAVFVEPVQGEAGALPANNEWLKDLRNKCDQTGTLLVFDEIQTGMGRTGSLFCFEQYGVIPDILCLAKALGGGMPLGAFISSKVIMGKFSSNPALGHITTFGGHPVCCAAGLAALKILLEEPYIFQVKKKETLMRDKLMHPKIKEVRGKGLMLAIQFESMDINFKVIEKCIAKGLMTDWFLFNDSALRIVPPLTISDSELEWACDIIIASIDEV